MSRAGAAPLFIGLVESEQLARLKQIAEARPVDILAVMELLKTEAGAEVHRARMTSQTVILSGGPFEFWVTFALERNHPPGTCRHMSMSIQRAGRVPSPEAVWTVAEHFGFTGSLETCGVWQEKLRGHGVAVNVVQPILMGDG